jgi:hypothetical protein
LNGIFSSPPRRARKNGPGELWQGSVLGDCDESRRLADAHLRLTGLKKIFRKKKELVLRAHASEPLFEGKSALATKEMKGA